MEHQFNGAFESADFNDPISVIAAIVGVEPELVTDYDSVQLDPAERLQIRIDKNNAPKEMVQRFAAQMAIAQFPPIVVTADHHIVDGNTRYQARRLREERYFPAYVIPISYDSTDRPMQLRLLYLGHMLNNSAGKPLDRNERRVMVREAIVLGMNDRQISQTVGFKTTQIAAARHEVNAENRLGDLGVEQADTVRDASLRALGKVVEFHDEPFKHLAELVRDAGLGAREIGAVAASVKDAGSDSLALEVIARERAARAVQIADRARGGSGSPPAARLLRQRVGFITNREVEALVEHNTAEMAGHLEVVRQAIEILNQVVNRQQELLAA